MRQDKVGRRCARFFRLTEATGSMAWLAPPDKTMIKEGNDDAD
jgi:hypothetical protein